MLDEKKLRLLESRLDAWRMRRKDADKRKTYDEVFDEATLLTLFKLISGGVVETVDYPVSTGKEGNVFHATAPDGQARALKLYRVNNATFRSISRYVIGDPRFKDVGRSHREVIYAWALKEYKNLLRMFDSGTRVPKPHYCLNNALVMQYIGDESTPAPMIRDVEIHDPQAVFLDVLENLKRIRRAELVHGDMSEYNMLFWDGKVVVIDCGQAVPLDHPASEEWFKRDIANVCRYFARLGVRTDPIKVEKEVRGD